MAQDSGISGEAKTARFEWYQTDGCVIISFFVKGLKEDTLELRCDSQNVHFSGLDETDVPFSARVNLAHPVKENCERKVLRTKVEVKLYKTEALRWDQLERKVMEKDFTAPGSTKKWSQLEKDLKEAEASEKPEGDAALMKLFQDIYGSGSDEVKKAMMKSFYESNGTVLSTNWQEVGEKEVDVKAPDGMEYKKWTN